MDFINIEIIWLIIGILFLISEFFVPHLVIGFFGAGALTTALVTWIGLTDSIQLQLIVFSVSSLLYLFILRRV